MRRIANIVCWPLVVTVFAWGFNFVSLKVLFQSVPDAAVSLTRWVAMYAVLLLVCWIRKERLKPDAGDWPRILFAGFISLGAYMILFLRGLDLTTPSEGAIMLATVPVLTAILAFAFRLEKFEWATLLGALIAFAGVGLVELGGGAKTGGSWLGNAMILASALLWALGIILSRPLLRKYSPLAFLTMSMPGALPALIPFGLASTLQTRWSGIPAIGWLHFLQVSVLSGVIAFQCFYMGVAAIGASNASNYQFVVPLLTALFGYLIFGSLLAPLQWVGFVVVLASVAFVNARRVAKLESAKSALHA